MPFYIGTNLIVAFHDCVLTADKESHRGILNESNLHACVDRHSRDVFGVKPYKGMIDKAAALMFSINRFHPFVDGNKRTALLATFFFLFMNGYELRLTREAVDISVDVANRRIDDEEPIKRWLHGNTKRDNKLWLITHLSLILFVIRTRTWDIYLNVDETASVRIAEQLLELTKDLWKSG